MQNGTPASKTLYARRTTSMLAARGKNGSQWLHCGYRGGKESRQGSPKYAAAAASPRNALSKP